MLKFWKKQSINQINIIAILFAGIFAFTSAFVVIFNEYMEFEKDLKLTDINYIKTQKKITVEQTVRLDRLIKYRLNQLKDKSYSELVLLLTKEIGFILDHQNSINYVFIYGKNGLPIYESQYAKHSTNIIKKLIKTGKNRGGFLTFIDKDRKNIAYARNFEDLNWIIGSGTNIDEKDVVLAQKKEEHRNKIASFMLKIITLTLFLYIASILKYRYITDKITKEINFIVKSLKHASKNYQFIDRSQIKFEEFREITSQANYMITKLKEKKSALENLNTNLENLVKLKTEELQKSVEYSKELLADQDKFLKNAIHELNTPLSIILMNIDLYNLKHVKSPYLMKIEAAVKVLENIYGDLSYIVKKDRVDHSVDMVNFTEFIKARIEYFGDVAIGNKLHIKSEIEDDIFVLFNEFELQRLCDNNISNAIKYSHMHQTIYVRLNRYDGCTMLEIENKGEKIVSVDKLFHRYYREDGARGGFGLGLNIVHEICEKNHVQIKVKSDEERTIFRYFFECSRRIM
jgi:signal transduction histidine kinase